MSETTTFTPGPWDWQLFGDDWCLTGQYGRRPIIFSRDHKKGFRLRDAERDLLVPFTPAHPDALLMKAAPDMLTVLEAAWPLLLHDGHSDVGMQVKQAIDLARGQGR